MNVIEISQPDNTTDQRQRHGTNGEKPWPSVGRIHDRQRGDQMATNGENFMAAVTRAKGPVVLFTISGVV